MIDGTVDRIELFLPRCYRSNEASIGSGKTVERLFHHRHTPRIFLAFFDSLIRFELFARNDERAMLRYSSMKLFSCLKSSLRWYTPFLSSSFRLASSRTKTMKRRTKRSIDFAKSRKIFSSSISLFFGRLPCRRSIVGLIITCRLIKRNCRRYIYI